MPSFIFYHINYCQVLYCLPLTSLSIPNNMFFLLYSLKNPISLWFTDNYCSGLVLVLFEEAREVYFISVCISHQIIQFQLVLIRLGWPERLWSFYMMKPMAKISVTYQGSSADPYILQFCVSGYHPSLWHSPPLGQTTRCSPVMHLYMLQDYFNCLSFSLLPDNQYLLPCISEPY